MITRGSPSLFEVEGTRSIPGRRVRASGDINFILREKEVAEIPTHTRVIQPAQKSRIWGSPWRSNHPSPALVSMGERNVGGTDAYEGHFARSDIRNPEEPLEVGPPPFLHH